MPIASQQVRKVCWIWASACESALKRINAMPCETTGTQRGNLMPRKISMSHRQQPWDFHLGKDIWMASSLGCHGQSFCKHSCTHAFISNARRAVQLLGTCLMIAQSVCAIAHIPSNVYEPLSLCRRHIGAITMFCFMT